MTLATMTIADLGSASTLLKHLAHPIRLGILCRLAGGEVSVGELEKDFVLPQPTLSKHLADLRGGSLVTARRNGKSVIYRLSDDRAEMVVRILRTATEGVAVEKVSIATPAAVFARLVPRPAEAS